LLIATHLVAATEGKGRAFDLEWPFLVHSPEILGNVRHESCKESMIDNHIFIRNPLQRPKTVAIILNDPSYDCVPFIVYHYAESKSKCD